MQRPHERVRRIGRQPRLPSRWIDTDAAQGDSACEPLRNSSGAFGSSQGAGVRGAKLHTTCGSWLQSSTHQKNACSLPHRWNILRQAASCMAFKTNRHADSDFGLRRGDEALVQPSTAA